MKLKVPDINRNVGNPIIRGGFSDINGKNGKHLEARKIRAQHGPSDLIQYQGEIKNLPRLEHESIHYKFHTLGQLVVPRHRRGQEYCWNSVDAFGGIPLVSGKLSLTASAHSLDPFPSRDSAAHILSYFTFGISPRENSRRPRATYLPPSKATCKLNILSLE